MSEIEQTMSGQLIGTRTTFYRRFGKRLLDLALTIPACIVLIPVFLVVAALIRLRLGGPVFFRHQRTGLHGRPFTVIKFRTMTNTRDAAGKLLPDTERLTPLGRFLRAASLDELPQLFNVLLGDMSLVGPRPLITDYLHLYNPTQARRHETRPGVTGLAQVKGRRAMTWEDKFDLDVWYVENCGLWLDLKIILRTVVIILTRQGISAPPGSGIPYKWPGSKPIDLCATDGRSAIPTAE
jgi:lipopolysaccharide/colanic/teichoic acid biosynthesis glycosyltransferase